MRAPAQPLTPASAGPGAPRRSRGCPRSPSWVGGQAEPGSSTSPQEKKEKNPPNNKPNQKKNKQNPKPPTKPKPTKAQSNNGNKTRPKPNTKPTRVWLEKEDFPPFKGLRRAGVTRGGGDSAWHRRVRRRFPGEPYMAGGGDWGGMRGSAPGTAARRRAQGVGERVGVGAAACYTRLCVIPGDRGSGCRRGRGIAEESPACQKGE